MDSIERIKMKPNGLSCLLKDTDKATSELVGIEYTDEENDVGEEKPYNPDDIRIYHKFFSVSDICRWMGADPPTITVKPSFQRNLVWSEQKKSLLIESLMLRIPIPSFYFYEDDIEHKSVIDGLQRLSAIYDYVAGEFPLFGLQYLGDKCNGKKYHELDKKYISRIEETQLSINILDNRTPELVKFDVFRRVNTGGVPLNPQEIRNALAHSRTTELLLRMSHSNGFLEATHGLVKDIRMDAQELCLRFITFYRAYDTHLMIPHKDRSIAKMLDECVSHLNSCDDNMLRSYYEIFETAMKKSTAAFGERAFIKPGQNVINKLLFTSWSVTLAYSGCTYEMLRRERESLIDRLTSALHNDYEYFNAITTSTASKRNIEKQFLTAYSILEELRDADKP